MALLLSGVHSASAWAQNVDFETARTQAVVLEGDFAIGSQEDLDGLIAAAGDRSFVITGNLTVEQSPLATLAGLDKSHQRRKPGYRPQCRADQPVGVEQPHPQSVA